MTLAKSTFATAFEPSHGDTICSGVYTATEYRQKALFDDEDTLEKQRKEINKNYAKSIADLNSFSFKRPYQITEYYNAAIASLETRQRELCHVARAHQRFKRFRARQKTEAEIANRVVFEDINNKIKEDNLSKRQG